MPQSRPAEPRRRIFDMNTSAERLTALEIRAAEQERAIEELSGQVAEQWKVIDGIRKKLDALTERFLALEEQAAPEVPVTRPPHW
jgi:SlyX protein